MEKIFSKLNRFFRGKWRPAVLNIKKGLWIVDTGNIPYLKAQNANGNHILIQPDYEIEPYYLLVDDLNPHLLYRHHDLPESQTWKPGRMIIETSPANYQVWIHSSRPLPPTEKQYWLQRLGSDPGAAPKHRWGRCPGFFNKKEKHKTNSGRFPLAKLIWVDWKQTADIPIVIPSNPDRPICQNRYDHIRRSKYDRGNESVTDFAYALALARRNFSKQQIINRLMEERADWTNHKGESRKKQYLDRTVRKAIHIIRESSA